MQLVSCASTQNGAVEVVVQADTHQAATSTAAKQIAERAATEKLGRVSLERAFPAVGVTADGQVIAGPGTGPAVAFQQRMRFRASI